MSEFILFILLYKFIGDIHHKLRSMVDPEIEEARKLDKPLIAFVIALIILILIWHFYGKIDTGDVFD